MDTTILVTTAIILLAILGLYGLSLPHTTAKLKRDKARRESIKRTTVFSDAKIDEIEARLEDMGELGDTLSKGIESGSVRIGI